MTDLHIAVLSASTTAADEPRVRRLLTGVAERRLEQALAGLELPAGEWCIRRLDVPLLLSDRQGDAAVELDWARALAAALREALDQAADLVHYPRPVAALTDLLVGMAIGRTERLWAWRQLGIVQAGDPDPVGAPAAATLAALRRRPAEAMPALITAVPRAGVAALHRLFGPAGWNELARLVIAGLAGDPALAIPPDRPAYPVPGRSAGPAENPNENPNEDPNEHPAEQPDEPARRLAAGIAARSALHRAAVRSRLRPDRDTGWAWAALATAEVAPALYSRPVVHATLARLSDSYQTVAGPHGSSSATLPPRPAARPMPESDERTRAVPFVEQRTGARQSNAEPVAGELAGSSPSDRLSDTAATTAHRSDRPVELGSEPPAPAETGWPTEWAGLPFFLATAEAAGLPGALLADEVLAGQPVSWLVYQLGRLLVPVVDPLDPALFGLAGQLPAPVPPAEPSPTESGRLAEHARRWAELTAARLGRSDEPPLVVAQDLAGRPGMVFGQPGWIEIHLSLQGVRLDVRRAGLDLDPGWLRWLGAVVSFVYE